MPALGQNDRISHNTSTYWTSHVLLYSIIFLNILFKCLYWFIYLMLSCLRMIFIYFLFNTFILDTLLVFKIKLNKFNYNNSCNSTNSYFGHNVSWSTHFVLIIGKYNKLMLKLHQRITFTWIILKYKSLNNNTCW